MTRPAINYNTFLSQSGIYTWLNPNGSISAGPFAVSNADERRLCSKPASIKTTPRRKGQYVTPTTYAMSWGRWKADPYGRVEIAPGQPGFGKYAVWSVSPLSGVGYDPSTFYTVPSSVENQLLVKALNKLRNNRVNFGVALGEAKETAELFSSSLHRITKTVVDFRHRRPKDWLKVIGIETGVPVGLRTRQRKIALNKAIPNSWLEVQYGWNPLMQDVSGACSSLSNTLEFEPRRVVCVKSSKRIQTTSEWDIVWNPGYARTTVQTDIDVTAKVQLCYTLSNFPTALLSSLGLTNPLEVVWELVPYSFVVDWFLPVGNWLSAMGGDFGYSFVNGSYTRFKRYKDSVRRLTPSNTYANPLGGSVSGLAVHMQRTVYSSSPWPGLSFKSPVSVGHLANALSLLTNAFR